MREDDYDAVFVIFNQRFRQNLCSEHKFDLTKSFNSSFLTIISQKTIVRQLLNIGITYV